MSRGDIRAGVSQFSGAAHATIDDITQYAGAIGPPYRESNEDSPAF
jgi:hypothetical protein